MDHAVVLVDENDRRVGSAEKRLAHTEGWLHRAFSIFIFDSTGRLLLQQRASDKYHSGGLWSNTCCSHPRPAESPREGAHRRLGEEMGFECDLTPAFQETYRLPVGANMIEHEHNHVFIGTADEPQLSPHPDEVADWAWIHPSSLQNDMQRRPHRYTPWFRLLLDQATMSSSTFDEEQVSPESIS